MNKTKFRCGECKVLVIDPNPVKASADGKQMALTVCPKCGEVLAKPAK